MNYITLGRRIREERIKLHLTQEQLAEDVSLSTAYIGQVERGERHITLNNLVLIVNRLNISIDYLLKGSLDANPDDFLNVLEQLMNGRTDAEKLMAIDTVKLIFNYLDKKNK